MLTSLQKLIRDRKFVVYPLKGESKSWMGTIKDPKISDKYNSVAYSLTNDRQSSSI